MHTQPHKPRQLLLEVPHPRPRRLAALVPRRRRHHPRERREVSHLPRERAVFLGLPLALPSPHESFLRARLQRKR